MVHVQRCSGRIEWNFTIFFLKEGKKVLHSALSGAHLCLVVWIEEQSIWTFPKPSLSVHPDGPNRPDAGGEEVREISEGPSGAQVWNGTKDGSETTVSLLCPHRYCLDNCISDKLLGCGGGGGGGGGGWGAVSRKLDFSQGRQDMLTPVMSSIQTP